MSSPNFTAPCKNSTLLIVPSLSAAVALNATVAPAVNVALLVGLLSVTVGAATFHGRDVYIGGECTKPFDSLLNHAPLETM